mmetsp:Transcript_131159/g.365553  ORF Transcript_131159/g.365553 Transcript_131159/m.365553 type:complete len:211 (+) Transcript_131159:139-771(+)
MSARTSVPALRPAPAHLSWALERLRGQPQRQLGIQPDTWDSPQVPQQLHSPLISTSVHNALESLRQEILGQAPTQRQQGGMASGETWRHARQAVGRPDQTRDLLDLTLSEEAAEQQRVGAHVRADTVAQHPPKDLERPPVVLVGSASMQQIVVHMDIPREVVLFGEVLAELEGRVNVVAAVCQLCNQRECEIAGPHAIPLHVIQDCNAFV